MTFKITKSVLCSWMLSVRCILTPPSLPLCCKPNAAKLNSDGLLLFEILLADTGGADSPLLPLLSMGVPARCGKELSCSHGDGWRRRIQHDWRPGCILILLLTHGPSSSACNATRRLFFRFGWGSVILNTRIMFEPGKYQTKATKSVVFKRLPLAILMCFALPSSFLFCNFGFCLHLSIFGGTEKHVPDRPHRLVWAGSRLGLLLMLSHAQGAQLLLLLGYSCFTWNK